MVLGFELWPLVEEERRHVKRCQRALGFFFPRSGCGKSCFIHDDLQSDDVLPGHP